MLRRRIDREWASRLYETCIIPERRFKGPFLSAGLIKVGFEQDRIPTVRLEADIHNVANDRHQADEEVERNIAQHSGFDARWKADLTGLADHHQREVHFVWMSASLSVYIERGRGCQLSSMSPIPGTIAMTQLHPICMPQNSPNDLSS